MSTSKEETPGTTRQDLADMMARKRFDWEAAYQDDEGDALVAEVRRLRALLPEAFDAGYVLAKQDADEGMTDIGRPDPADYQRWLVDGLPSLAEGGGE